MLTGFSNKGDLRDDNVFNGIPGSTVGAGDFDACVAAVKSALLPSSDCSAPPCVFGGVSQPHLSDVGCPPCPFPLSLERFYFFFAELPQIPQKLLAFENFYFILEGLGKQSLPADVSIGEYKTLGSQYCKLSMPLAQGSPAALLSDPERYCFGSAFAPCPVTPNSLVFLLTPAVAVTYMHYYANFELRMRRSCT
jgi:hypothetical protein